MARLSSPLPALLALALAAALAGAPATVQAQQVRTSLGVRMLTPLDKLSSEAQLLHAQVNANRVLSELLADVAAVESLRGGATKQVDTLGEDYRRASRQFELANATFNEADQKYKTDLAAFQQSTIALEAEAQRQRAAGTALNALPIEQRTPAEMTRINDWAAQITTRRQQIEAEQARLLAEHDRIEGERAKLAKMRADNDARLRSQRDSTVAALTGSGSKRIATYAELRIAVLYMRELREKLSNLAGNRTIAHSPEYDEAERKLRAFEAEQRSRQQ